MSRPPKGPENPSAQARKVFLLSPASTSGKRAELLFNTRARFALAQRLHDGEEVPVGEIFSFLSGLYFRGKLAYAERYARAGLTGDDVFIMTSNRGLVRPSSGITLQELKAFSATPIDLKNAEYRSTLENGIGVLVAGIRDDDAVILLGSIATGKYVDLLMPYLHDRLLFPAGFAGLGDMSRGSILLKSVQSGVELEYLSVKGSRRTFSLSRTRKLTR